MSISKDKIKYKVKLKGEKEEVTVSVSTGLRLQDNLMRNTRDGFFKAIEGLFSVASIKSIRKELETSVQGSYKKQVQDNLVEVDYFNKKRVKMGPEERAKYELKTRIIHGLTERQKEKLAKVEDKLLKLLEKYFKKHKDMPSCPFPYWRRFIQFALGNGNKASIYYKMIVKDDGAAERWKARKAEWYDFHLN